MTAIIWQPGRAIFRIVVALALVFGLSPPLLAQTRAPRAYIELLGNGLVVSVNYEQPVYGRFDVRVGGSGLWLKDWKYVLGLTMVGWQPISGTHGLRLAAGAGMIYFADIWFLEGNSETTSYATATVAYRYQPRRRGVFFQLALTPVLADRTVLTWGGFAVGYAF